VLIKCATWNNTGGRSSDVELDIDTIELTGDPFDGKASGDFRPNSTSGAGAALTAAGVYPPSSTDNETIDVGAVQHEDAGGVGSTNIIRRIQDSLIGR
jgi:hypothetical protein